MLRMDSVQVPYSLIATIGSGLIAFAATVYATIMSRRKDEAEANLNMSGAWSETVQEMRQEITRLHTRVEALEAKDAKNRKTIHEMEDQMRQMKLHLDMAESILDMVLEWTNTYTPALKKAGIEPINVDELRFRGDDDTGA